MKQILMDQIINSNYIKYERLTAMVNEAFVGSNATSLNVYIDLYSILKQLYKDDVYTTNDYTTITSCIINMIAHYREFFKTRYGVYSKFFIVYSKNCGYINSQFCADYNIKNKYLFNSNKRIDEMIEKNLKLLDIICPSIPGVYFVNGTFETGVIILDLICRNEICDISTPHIVITKDVYNYQLVALRNNVTIFRPKKINGVDSSFYINKSNLMSYYMVSRKSSKIDEIKVLMPGTLSLLMTLSSVNERNIKSLTNIQSAIKIVKSMIDDYKILNGYNSIIPDISSIIANKKLNTNQNEFECRFKAIDIQFQHMLYINTPEATNIKFIDVNYVDGEGLRKINDQYFKNNPLDLNRL